MSIAHSRNFGVVDALRELERDFLAANPNSVARYAEACRHLPGGNTRSILHYAPLPLALERGEGCYVWDLDGHRYADFLCEYSAGLYGHSNPLIGSAIRDALASGVVLGGPNVYEARLAEALTSRFASLDYVRFCNSGSEANLMAVSVARAITGRDKLLVFEEAYHGGFLMFAHGGSPLNVPLPVVSAPYNDIDAALGVIEREKESLAAVLVEPMLFAGGCIAAEQSFLEALREATERYRIVLIFDEVVTSRLSPGGLQGVCKVFPDMTTLGKYLGGGLTFGAFGGSARIMQRFDPARSDAFFHAGTFNNNVLTMAAGLAGITEVYTAQAATALNARGEALRARLEALITKHGVSCCVSGRGSTMNLHFAPGPVRSPRDLAGEPAELQRLLHLDLLRRGLYTAPRGLLALSLPMGDAEIGALANAVDGFFGDYAALLE